MESSIVFCAFVGTVEETFREIGHYANWKGDEKGRMINTFQYIEYCYAYLASYSGLKAGNFYIIPPKNIRTVIYEFVPFKFLILQPNPISFYAPILVVNIKRRVNRDALVWLSVIVQLVDQLTEATNVHELFFHAYVRNLQLAAQYTWRKYTYSIPMLPALGASNFCVNTSDTLLIAHMMNCFRGYLPKTLPIKSLLVILQVLVDVNSGRKVVFVSIGPTDGLYGGLPFPRNCWLFLRMWKRNDNGTMLEIATIFRPSWTITEKADVNGRCLGVVWAVVKRVYQHGWNARVF